jgi:hypothetical protein
MHLIFQSDEFGILDFGKEVIGAASEEEKSSLDGDNDNFGG